ncbi:MAG: fibronectin type III domain-containing protein, partial [Planctomycetota bacterium]|nr:fibronectin type III domain-containing protein [Planctomycetota bacterium]
TATVAGGAVTGFTIITPGSGYSATPSVYLSSGGVGGTGATATATIANGAVTAIAVGAGGSGYTSPPGIYFVGGGGSCAHAKATILNGAITAITVTDGGSGYTTAPTVLVGASTEVKMVEAIPCNLPQNWAADGRDGGLPDPATSGPPIIQIGTEGGIQPAPVVIPSTPVGYNYNRRDIVVLNVSTHGLFLGPAERSDIIIDFSQCPPGSKLILYNDAPAPVPAFDPRNDYYTGDPDQTDMGGAPTTPPGWGPNTRTVMQFIVDPAGTPAPKPTLLPSLNAALPTAFAASQPPLPVPAGVYARISDTSLNTGAPAGIDTVQVLAGGSGYTSPPTIGFVGGGGSGAIATAVLTAGSISAINVTTQGAGYTTTPTVTITGGGGSGGMAYAHIAGATTLLPKAIQELFDLHGRMNATLGVELPFTTALVQTTIPLGYVDPPTETVLGGQTQLWKITHNGVDTHAIHVHLFNAQVINRVGWDGAIRPPLPEEIGWKETIKMNPLEDIIIAVQPIIPTLPFKLGDSIRPLDVTMPLGTSAQFTGVDPNTGNPVTVTNQITNFGWEYVWHCHLLGHEENDMMRPLVALVSPAMPTNLHATTAALPMSVTLTWTNAATTPAATVYSVRRSTNALFTANVVTLPTQPLVGAPTIVDASVTPLTTYYYEVRAENAAAYSQWTAPLAVTTPAPPIPAVPTNLRTTGIGTTFVILAWNYTANNAPAQGFRVQRLIGTTWTTIATTGATTLTYRVNGLTTKTQYQFRVQSFNASGPSAFTPTLTVTTN